MTVRALRPARALVAAIAIAMVAVILVPFSATTASAVNGSVSGVVFNDSNHDGSRQVGTEPGIENVTVLAYDSAGDLVGTAVTSSAGAYTISVLGAATSALRIEVVIPAGYESTRVGTGGMGTATSVRFGTLGGGMNPSLNNQHFGLVIPGDYCQDNPTVCTTVFPWQTNTPADLASTGFVSTPYSSIEVRNATSPNPVVLSPGNQTGPMFGLAYDSVTGSLYGSSYLRRKAPFQNDETGVIYRRLQNGTLSVYANLNSLFYGTTNHANSAGGPNPHPLGSTNWLNDTATADLIGKRGLGDLDISHDGLWLYTVGLNDKNLYVVPTTETPTASNVARIPIVTASIGNCPTSDIQPFGIGIAPDGRVLIGGVCSAATSLNNDDLKYYIWELNSSGTAVTLVSTLDVDNSATMPRSNLNDAPNAGYMSRWNAWATWNENWALADRATTSNPGPNVGREVFPQPMLSDIEFIGNDLVLGVRDRYGDQVPGNGRPEAGGQGGSGTSQNPWPRGQGDVLRVCLVGGNYVMQGVGVTGCDTGADGEWFGDDQASDWWKESSLGGIAVHARKPGVLSTAYDPRAYQTNGSEIGDIYDENGIVNLSKSNTADGTAHIGGYRVYASGGSGAGRHWAKSNGLGDLELLCDAAPLEIGNLVWNDQNGNGIQDAGEPGINGVTVRLYKVGPGNSLTLAGTAVTSGNGQYFFRTGLAEAAAGNNDNTGGGLEFRSEFLIRLDLAANYSSGPLAGLLPTTANAVLGTEAYVGQSDFLDSDATVGAGTYGVNAFPSISVPASAMNPGENDHTFDFGFKAPTPPQARDLALRKTVVGMNGAPIGGSVTFRIEIFNQTADSVEDVTITDYIDTNSFQAMTVLPAPGVTGGAAALPYSWDNSSTTSPTVTIDGVIPGNSSVWLDVTLTIAQPVNLSGLLNTAEITRFDTDGDANNGDSTTGDVYDIDSKPNAINNDVLIDDVINLQRWTNTASTSTENNAVGDEDDHDIAIVPIYDLALIKKRAADQPSVVIDGSSTATFDITVKNQGETTAYNVTVLDSPVSPLARSASTQASQNLVASPSNTAVTVSYNSVSGTFTIPVLAPGDSITFQVVTDLALTNAVQINRAEISGFDNDADTGNVKPSWVQDLDSTPDTDPNNDALQENGQVFPIDSHNNVDNAPVHGPNALDEDDHDAEGVEVALLRIGSTVYKDVNGNHVGDPGEEVPGVLVQLLDEDDNVIASTVTNAGGDYSFDQLYPGTYRVGIPADQSGATQPTTLNDWNPVPLSANPPSIANFDNDGEPQTGFISRTPNIILTYGAAPLNDTADTADADALTFPRTYTNANSNLNIDFVFEQVRYELGNLVWLDNGAGAHYNNGIADADEGGINGVEVQLYRDNGAGAGVANDGVLHPDELIATTVTVGGGYYTFTDLVAADDYVVFIPASSVPLGYGTSGVPVLVGDEVPLDTDNNNNGVVYGSTGWYSGPVSLGPVGVAEPIGERDGTTGDPAQPAPQVADNRANQTVDFGFIPSVRIGNQVWHDESDADPTTQVATDNNGVFDAGEVGLVGVVVELWLDVDPNDGDFDPLVDLKVDETVTNSEGNYWFTGVRPDLPYFVAIQSIGSLVGVNPSSSAGQSSDPVNADNDDDGAPVAGYIAVSKAFTPSLGDASENEQDAVEPGDGVSVADDTAEIEANLAGPAYDDDDSELHIDFGFVNVPRYRLGNLVWLDNGGDAPNYVAANENNGRADINEPGIQGVQVQLFAVSDVTFTTPLATVLTDANGKYAFENLVAGDYVVRIAAAANSAPLAGLVSTMDGAVANADVDNDDNGVEISGGWASSVVSLNAANAYMGGEPTNEVLRYGVATDDDNGMAWSDPIVGPFAYHDNRSNFTVDFGFSPVYRIGNLVWFDANNDGLAQTGEPGLDGVEVELYRDGGPEDGEFIGATSTSSGGYYEFTGLPSGNYVVHVTGWGLPAGLVPGGTPRAAGSGAGEDVDNDNNANPAVIGFSSGTVFLGASAEPTNETSRYDDGTDDDNDSFADARSNKSVDFGFWPGLRLGNLVWHDESDADPTTVAATDNNGVVDAGEQVLPGVRVELWRDIDEDGVFEPSGDDAQSALFAYTDFEGNYLFFALEPGKYFVAIPSLLGPWTHLVPSSVIGAADNQNKGASVPGFRSVSAQIDLTVGGALTGEEDALPAADGSAEAEANVTAGTVYRDVDSYLQYDFGFVAPPTYRIGNLVWRDENRNGIADVGEDGINGVLVQLLDSNGTVINETLTATINGQAGNYEFTTTHPSLGASPLVAGDYTVRIPKNQVASVFFLPASVGALSGLNSTTDLVNTVGPDDANADDDNNDDGVDTGSHWTSPVITVGPGQSEPTNEILRHLSPTDDDTGWSGGTDGHSNFTVDFGFYPGLRLGDFVWYDDGYMGAGTYNYANENNGVYDPFELPIMDVPVWLYVDNGNGTFEPGGLDGAPVAITMTDNDGHYFFTGLDDSIAYWVAIPASAQSAGQPLFGWLNSDGQAADGFGTNNRDHGAPAAGFAAVSPLVQLSRGGMTYGEASDEAHADFHLGSVTADGNSNLVIDFGFKPAPRYELGNLVWLDDDNGLVDAGELGIPDVTVQLFADDGAVPGEFDETNTLLSEVTTDGDGRYSFSYIPAGRYFVFVPEQTALAHLDLSLGRFDNVNPSLLAHDNDNNGHPFYYGGDLLGWVSNVTILGDGPDDHSEPTGEVDTNTFAPADDNYPRDDRADQTIDFGFSERLRLGNLVWLDESDSDPATEVSTDNDGFYNPEAGEVPLVGVAVTLWRDIDGNGFQGVFSDDELLDIQVTDASGHYLFTRLLPGDGYYVAIEDVGIVTPAFGSSGARSSAGQSADSEQFDNDDDGAPTVTHKAVSREITLTLDPDEATGETDGYGEAAIGAAEAAANAASGVTYLDVNSQLQVDFGFVNVPLYRVGNLVWHDTNANGIAEDGESGIPGVKVVLYAADGTELAVAITDSEGKYSFENLVAGDYYVGIPDDQTGAEAGLNQYALSNLVNTPGYVPSNADIDNWEHGDASSFPAPGINATVVTLGAGPDDAFGTEPISERLRDNDSTDDDTGWSGGTDNRSNFTVDFGFYQQLRLGNLVWLDDGNVSGGYDPTKENNGIADPGEMGINGVTVHLYLSDGDNGFDPGVGDVFLAAVDTQTIGGQAGIYSFDGLDAAEYYVAIVGDEAVFDTLRLATNPAGDSESADDDNDGESTGAAGYRWVSGPVTLDYGQEPTDEAGNFLEGTSGAAEAALNAFYEALNGAAPYLRSDSFSQLRVDFGFSPVPVYALGNLVWEDWNNNGVVDAGEPGIEGVTVELYDAADTDFTTLLDSDVTDADGQYQFTDLPAGDYVVRIAAPGSGDVLDGWFVGGAPVANADNDVDNDNNAVPDAGNGGWTTGVVTLGEGDDNSEPTGEADDNTSDEAPTAPRDDRSNQTVDFGFWRGLRLGNQVWLDEGAGDNQNNGVYDSDETPIAGVTVELWIDEGDGVFDPNTDIYVGAQLTDTEGRYYFEGLPEGEYFVAIDSVPGGGVQSSTNTTPSGLDYDSEDDGDPVASYLSVSPLYVLTVGGAPTSEIDGPGASGGNAETNANTRSAGAAYYPDANSYLTVDFGFIDVPVYRIGNLVWNDLDNDGVAETGEPGIAGVLVQLYQGATWVGSTHTDIDGYYEFTNLVAGDYQVVIPTDQSAAVAPAALNGYQPSSVAAPNANNDSDNDSNANGGTLGAIDGYLSGVVRLGPATPGGNPDIEPENETVRADDATDDDLGQAYTVAPPQARIDDDRSNYTVDFGFYSITLGNLVFFDVDGDRAYEPGDGDYGIGDVTVNLYHYDTSSSTWVLVDTTETDLDGLYLFRGLVEGGQYYVEIPASQFVGAGNLVGLFSSPGTEGDIETVTTDNRDRGVDPASLYGAVRSDGAATVSATGEPTGENPNNNPAGTPDVASNLTVDFGFYAMELGGVVWEDNGGTGPGEYVYRNDGLYDRVLEGAFEDVVLLLFEADGTTPFLRADGTQATTTTDANGEYRFTGLPAGQYVVTVAESNFAPGGALEGYANSDGNDLPAVPPAPPADLDDVDEDNGYPESGDIFSGGAVSASALTLTVAGEPTTDPAPSSGYAHYQSNLTVDFGFWNASIGLELGNQIWFDDNRDGIYDVGIEAPAPAGLIVLLMDADTEDILATTVTDANGQYMFTNLSAGRYRVGLAAENFAFGAPLYFYTATTGPGLSSDPDDEIDSDSNGLTMPDFSVWSGVVTLVAAAPILEIDPATVGIDDRMSDLTIDFGLVKSSEFADTGFAGANLLAAALALLAVGLFLVLARRRGRDY